MRALLLLLGICLSLRCYSQHLVIKGVEITGSAKDFIAQLEKKDFSLFPGGAEKGMSILKGSFAGYSNTILMAMHETGIVNQVGLILTDCEHWKDIKGHYLSIKEMYEEKYGVKPRSVEYFKNGAREGSGIEYIEMNNGNIEYYSVFNVDKGTIGIEIKSIDYDPAMSILGIRGKYALIVKYINKENDDMVRQKHLGDL